MFDSETDHLNWVNVICQLFCDDFRTNLFFGRFLHWSASNMSNWKLF